MLTTRGLFCCDAKTELDLFALENDRDVRCKLTTAIHFRRGEKGWQMKYFHVSYSLQSLDCLHSEL